MERRYQVSQAVYTDPMASSGGYDIVAASAGVEAQERAFLRSSAGISDYLSSETDPGPFFSLFELPTGRWALVRRAVEGRRRGVNRVVVHMLCLPRELLDHYEGNGALFVLCCRYRGRDGQPLALGPLSRQAASPAGPVLDELLAEPQAPDALRDLLLERIASRVDGIHAVTGWNPETLAGHLAALLGRLAEGRRILLPQELAFEHLLFLSLLLLPGRDHRETAWTTHLAPGVPVPFRLALSPDPAGAIAQQRDSGRWCVWSEIESSPLVDDHGQETPLLVLGRAASGDRGRLLEIVGGYSAHGLSLLADSARVARWLFDLDRSARDGFASLPELASYLARYRSDRADDDAADKSEDGWRGRDEPLQACLATAARLLAEPASSEAPTESTVLDSTTAEEVLDLMAGAGIEPPDLMAALADLRLMPTAGLSKPQLLAAGAAIALVQRRRRRHWDGASKRLLGELERHPWRLQVPYAAALLADLTLAIARAGGDDREPPPVLEQVVRHPPSLLRIRRQLEPSDLEAVTGLTAALLANGTRVEPERAADWIEGELLSRLDRSDAGLPADLLERSLAALTVRPAALRGALDSPSTQVQAAAVEQLSHWAESEPELARRALAGLSPASAPRALEQLTGLDLLVERLAAAGVPVLEWLPFALAAARRLDEMEASPQAARVLGSTVGRARLRPDEISPVGRAVARQIADAVRATAAGAGHRSLLPLAYPAFTTDRDVAEALFDTAGSILGREPGLAVGWYGELRALLTEQPTGAPEADWLLTTAWVRLAEAELQQLPDRHGWASTLERLPASRQLAVVEAWADRIPSLGDSPVERTLLDAFARFTPSEGRPHFVLRSALLARDVRAGRVDPEEAVNRLELLRSRFSLASSVLVEGIDRVLGLEPGGARVPAWLELLSGQHLTQTVQHFLEQQLAVLLESRVLELAHSERLPDPAALAGQPSLLTLAACLGSEWRREEERLAVHGQPGEGNPYSRALGRFLERSASAPLPDAFSVGLKAAGWRYVAHSADNGGSLRATVGLLGEPYSRILQPILERAGTATATAEAGR